MPPIALVAALGVLAFLAASRKESMAGGDGPLARALLPSPPAPAPTSAKSGVSIAALGYQSLDAAEKVQLFSDLPKRKVVEGGRFDGAEALFFHNGQTPAGKSAPALDVLYGANMGVGLPEKLAILVGKMPGGKTAVLAEGSGWESRVRPGGFWNVFLRPGEAHHVAKAARVPLAAVGLAKTVKSGEAALKAVFSNDDLALSPVVRSFVRGAEDLPALLSPVAGFIDEAAEARATTPAGALPDSLAAIRDSFNKANAAYLQNDIDGAKALSPMLVPTVHPLRDAGYALASAQVQTLLAKVGASIDD